MSDAANVSSNVTAGVENPDLPVADNPKRRKKPAPANEDAPESDEIAESVISLFQESFDANVQTRSVNYRWYYDVPKSEHEDAAKAGMRYDSNKRKWYIANDRCPGEIVFGFRLNSKHYV